MSGPGAADKIPAQWPSLVVVSQRTQELQDVQMEGAGVSALHTPLLGSQVCLFGSSLGRTLINHFLACVLRVEKGCVGGGQYGLGGTSRSQNAL